jgi:hypothetical protein
MVTPARGGEGGVRRGGERVDQRLDQCQCHDIRFNCPHGRKMEADADARTPPAARVSHPRPRQRHPVLLALLKEAWRKLKGLGNFQMNGGKENQRNISLDLSFKAKSRERENRLRPHCSIPMHKELSKGLHMPFFPIPMHKELGKFSWRDWNPSLLLEMLMLS